MCVLESLANFGESRSDDLEVDVPEHVFRFVLGRLIERIRHRKRRGRASELDKGNCAQFAEPPRQLTHDGGLGGDAEGGHRVAAHASDCVRERLLVYETRAQDRVGQGLAPGA